MLNVLFNFENKNVSILCNKEEKIKDTTMKFTSKTKIDCKNYQLLYNGMKLMMN